MREGYDTASRLPPKAHLGKLGPAELGKLGQLGLTTEGGQSSQSNG